MTMHIRTRLTRTESDELPIARTLLLRLLAA
jgi:hypothetical protein